MESAILQPFAQLPPGIVAGWTVRHGGVSRGPYDALNFGAHVGDEANHVAENRALLATAIGALEIVWLDQVHGTTVVAIAGSPPTTTPVADASITATPRLALAVMTADCVPVVVAASDGSCIGVAHAGWQGLEKGVVGKLLESMPACKPGAGYMAWIGPCIRPGHYPVGEEVWSRFASAYPQFVLPDDEAVHKRRLDLAGIAAAQLRGLGVLQVVDCGLCTYASDDLFSYRRASHAGNAATGRIATVVMLDSQEPV